MPRRRRIIFPGLPHHVTHRGNRKAAVYLDQQDREFYLDQLQKYTNLYEIQIYAYCLTARGKSRVGSRARDLRSLARHEEESMPGHRR